MTSDDPDAVTSVPSPAKRLQSIRRELDLLSREIEPADLATGPESDLRVLAQGLLWQRTVFADTLGVSEFVNPASNIMLFLYASATDVARSTGACCKAAGVPRTTALRWISILEQRRLLVTTADVADGRRTFVALTDEGRSTMDRCLQAISRAPTGGVVAL